MKKQIFLVLFFLGLVTVLYVSCGPTVKVEGPDKPIEINVNVRIDVYNHVAAVNDDIYGDAEEEEESNTGGQSILRGLFMQSAHADDASDYSAAKSRRKNRAKAVITYKEDGSLGENHRGYVQLIESSKVKNDEEYAEKVKKLIKDENSDRKTMYQIDAKKQGVSLGQIESANALYWRDKSKVGEWIEVEDGDGWTWTRKK